MLAFQQYQTEFVAHIRNPAAHKKPKGVNAARMAVYRSAVFNNIFESVSVCFPVCQAAIGKNAWRAIVKDFVKNFPAQSPIFREIPQQFLQYLSLQKDLPAYLQPLAHYEWVELAIAGQTATAPNLSNKMDLLHEKPVLAPAHMLLQYDFAVYKIAKRKLPKAIEPTYFLVFRNAKFEVKFIELNPMTFALLKTIDENNTTGHQALMQLATQLQHPNPAVIIQFGAEILADLVNQQAIIGSKKAA